MEMNRGETEVRQSGFIAIFARLSAWLAIAAAALMLAGLACSGKSTMKQPTTPTTVELPGVNERATLRGTLTLDGQPLQSRFLGAHVVRDGLATACQAAIPSVDAGQYEIPIMSDAEGRGCGAPGGQIVLWTSVGDQFLYTRQTLLWPGNGASSKFDATFSTADPSGASDPMTAFKGHVAHADGARLGGGTLLEAFIGETRCGVASVRYDDQSWFTLLVAGPQVAGCAKDGEISFRVSGSPAGGTAVNDLRGEASGSTIEVTVD